MVEMTNWVQFVHFTNLGSYFQNYRGVSQNLHLQ